MSGCGFSQKQRRVMTWWVPGSPDFSREAIVCDGAVRSGKTLAMGLGFFLWAGASFQGRRFALCGKTIGALRRNVLAELVPRLKELGATINTVSENTQQVERHFATIYEFAQSVQRQEEVIMRAMEEQSAGSGQVLEAMRSIHGITFSVSDSSSSVLQGSKEIDMEMRKLVEITGQITDSMNKMSSGAADVTGALEVTNAELSRNQAVLSELAKIMSQFNT